MAEWKDKVVIITGASSGIGAGIALEFAKEGCILTLVGRNEKNLNKTAEKCGILQGLSNKGNCSISSCSSKDKILCVIADMINDDDVKSIVAKTVEKFGKIDVLVNNAGIAKVGAIPDINMKDYDDIMRVNVRSVVLLTQEAVPHLIKTKGNIVNISSIAALKGVEQCSAYAMSKAALDHFTRCSAVDLAPNGVRINSVQPGLIDTPIFERMGLPKAEVDKMIQLNKSKHPMGRLGTPEDIGRTTLFLASEKSSFTTGQCIAVYGGFFGLNK